MMVGRHATQTFVEVGPLELKGLPEPVRCGGGGVGTGHGCGVGAVAGSAGRCGIGRAVRVLRAQSRSSRRSTRPASARSRRERCQVVFVAGEAGMGKTSLVAQVAAGRAWRGCGRAVRARRRGPRRRVSAVDRGRLGARPPRRPGGRRGCAFGAAGARWRVWSLTSVPMAIGSVIPTRNGSCSWRASSSCSWPRSQRAAGDGRARRPALGRHRQSPAACATSSRRRHRLNVTIACTYRDTDLGRGDPLDPVARRPAPRGQRHPPRPPRVWTTPTSSSCSRRRRVTTSTTTVSGSRTALRRETDGNPFFTGELLRHLGESGGIVLGDDGRWVAGR